MSSWGYDIFLSYWNVAVAQYLKIDDEKVRQIFLVYAWIDAAIATLLRKEPLLCSKKIFEENSKLSKDSKWIIAKGAELAERLNSLFPEIIEKEDARGTLVKEWLIRLANFLMPEVSGIEKEFVEPFGEKQELARFWKGSWSDVKQFRKEIFDRFEQMGMEKDLAQKLKDKGECEYAKTMGIPLKQSPTKTRAQPNPKSAK